MSSQKAFHVFRVTLKSLYSNPTCPGHRDPSQRNGHYLRADALDEVLAIVREKYPSEGITVQLWDWSDRHGEVIHDSPAMVPGIPGAGFTA